MSKISRSKQIFKSRYIFTRGACKAKQCMKKRAGSCAQVDRLCSGCTNSVVISTMWVSILFTAKVLHSTSATGICDQHEGEPAGCGCVREFVCMHLPVSLTVYTILTFHFYMIVTKYVDRFPEALIIRRILLNTYLQRLFGDFSEHCTVALLWTNWCWVLFPLQPLFLALMLFNYAALCGVCVFQVDK